jgi:hypothetical protein
MRLTDGAMDLVDECDCGICHGILAETDEILEGSK